MSDNVVRLFTQEREEKRAREELTGQRLSRAGAIRDKLCKKTRMSAPDKERLARNLGSMIEDVERKTNKGRRETVGKLFTDCQLDIKKRTRYIRFPEESGDGELAAAGSVFIRLSEEIAKIVPSDSPSAERMQRAILKLAEGISWLDDEHAARSRIQGDGKEEYACRMDQLLSIIQRQVDLSRYFDAISQTKLSPNYAEERAAHAELARNFPVGEPFHEYVEALPIDAEDGDWRKMRASKAAPQVTIGHLYIPRPISIAIPVVSNFEFPTEEVPLRKRLERALVETYGKGIAKDAVKMKYRSEFLEKYARAGNDLLDRISQLSPFWTMSGYWDRLDLVLTIERERSTEQAKLFLGCHFETDSEDADPVHVIGHTVEGDSGMGVGKGLEPGSLIWDWLVPLAVPLTNCYVLVGSPEGFAGSNELVFRTLKVGGEKGLNLAFHGAIRPSQYHEGIDPMCDVNYLGEWILRPAIHDALEFNPPVPRDSIAGAILRNLCGPPEKRLDTLLVQDARQKLAKIDEAIKTEKEKYLNAISRLGET